MCLEGIWSDCPKVWSEILNRVRVPGYGGYCRSGWQVGSKEYNEGDVKLRKESP